MEKINHSDIIRKLQYIAGFVGKKQNFEYNKINLALRDILKEELPDLLSHPNLTDKSIKVKIPYKLPLIYHHLAKQTKRALSNYFNIKTNKLPDLYIKVYQYCQMILENYQWNGKRFSQSKNILC